MTALSAGTDWEIVRVVKVVDGDTMDVILRRTLGDLDGFDLISQSKPDEPARLRPLHVDTPEDDEEGYDAATRDAGEWLLRRLQMDRRLRVTTYGKDSFGRYLSDVYSAGDREDTFSRHMLNDANDGKGWPAYRGR